MDPYADDFYKRHDNGMEALAEAACTPEEVEPLVYARVERAFNRAKKTHAEIGQARSMMWIAAMKFLGERYYVLPDKERVVKAWQRRFLKGYQKWWWKVERERKRLTKTGEAKTNARWEAMVRVSPELAETR